MMNDEQKRPEWLKVRAWNSEKFLDTLNIIRESGVKTVCEESLCPNISECWGKRTATFLVMGDICTRSCGFCNIKTGIPSPLDPDEPKKLAKCINGMKLGYAVITMVSRDDLSDGGAAHIAEIITTIRTLCVDTKIEILTSDFGGNLDALKIIVDAGPNVFAHNIEVTKSLHKTVKRPPSDYDTSIKVLEFMKKNSTMITKTGLIVGVGETNDEIHSTIDDIIKTGTDVMTIGQYLTPSIMHYPISRFISPEEFLEFKETGERKGLKRVISGPLIRSSYDARFVFGDICSNVQTPT